MEGCDSDPLIFSLSVIRHVLFAVLSTYSKSSSICLSRKFWNRCVL